MHNSQYHWTNSYQLQDQLWSLCPGMTISFYEKWPIFRYIIVRTSLNRSILCASTKIKILNNIQIDDFMIISITGMGTDRHFSTSIVKGTFLVQLRSTFGSFLVHFQRDTSVIKKIWKFLPSVPFLDNQFLVQSDFGPILYCSFLDYKTLILINDDLIDRHLL